MSHATADLEYFQCDMCQTYMHRDIYCDHRRECKGKDSQEIRKADVLRIAKQLDEETRYRSKLVAAGGTTANIAATAATDTTKDAGPVVGASRFAVPPKAIVTTTNLDKAQRQQGLRVLRTLETTVATTAMERLKGDEATKDRSCTSKDEAAKCAAEKKLLTADDIDDFLNS